MSANIVNSETITEVLQARSEQDIRLAFAQAHAADIADALEALTPEKRSVCWQHIADEMRGQVLAELNEGVFISLAEEIDKKELIESITRLDVDDIADLIPELPENLLADVLFAVDSETRSTLGEVLSYPEDSAGGLMNIDATAVRDDISMEVAGRFLRLKSHLPTHTDALYLVDRNNKLTGILPLQRLITAPLSDKTRDHAVRKPVYFDAMDDAENVANAFADYDLVSAPVVNEDNELIGRITVDDVVDLMRESAEQEMLARVGISHEEDIFAPIIQTSRNRAIWLGVNLLTALLGSWVIGQFEGSIQKLVALAVLMPIVASMGGNAGTQTLTVTIRGMSTGTITSGNTLSILRKEVLVGILNGLLWAFVIAIIAALWFSDISLGLVIAAAMVANLVMGAIAGVCLPVLLEKMNIDPALAGGVTLTTVTDVVGYFSVLGLATLLLL